MSADLANLTNLGAQLRVDATPLCDSISRMSASAAQDAGLGRTRQVDAGLWADYVLTAENLITGSLADDDVVMGGYHIGIHRPSGSTGGGGIAGRPATGGRDAWR